MSFSYTISLQSATFLISGIKRFKTKPQTAALRKKEAAALILCIITTANFQLFTSNMLINCH